MQVLVDTVIRDEGTIVVLEGAGEGPHERVRFGADHRCAQTIVEVLFEEGAPVPCDVPDWAVIGVVQA